MPGAHPGGLSGAALSWQWLVFVFVGVIAAAWGYVLAWRFRDTRNGSPGGEAFAWMVGMVFVFVALHPTPVSMAMGGSHLAYMLQLDALMSVAPPLLLLGLGPLLRPKTATPGEGGRRGLLVLPALGLAAWLATLYLWHLPTVHELGVRSQTLFAAQLLLFLAAGLLFWWPVVEPGGGRGRMSTAGKLAYLGIAQAGMAVLAAVLIWYPGDLYAHGHAGVPFGLSPLTDQRLAGVAMVVVDMTVASAAASWILLSQPTDPASAAE